MFLGRVVGPDDPLWLPDDREMAIAYLREKAEHCPHCGTRRGKPRDYYVGQQDTCPGCELLDQEQKNIPEALRAFTRPYLVPRHLLTEEQLTADIEGRG